MLLGWAESQGCEPLTLQQPGHSACTNWASLQDLPRDCYCCGSAFELSAPSLAFGKASLKYVLEQLKEAEGAWGVARTAPTWADVCARTQHVHSCMLTRAINTPGPSQLCCHVPEPGRRVCEDKHTHLSSPARPPVPPITPRPGTPHSQAGSATKGLGSQSRGSKQSMESTGAATTPRRSSQNPTPGDGEHLLKSLCWQGVGMVSPPAQDRAAASPELPQHCLLHCMEVATDGNFHALQSTTSG